ncbi:hypothetical protein Nepgr_017977 [Nepenthes gracilis]|uniref:Uncharacterized protein n=1 Tax=Nepenthes gracilis TaxID=150966 RepID=A0AAD3ST00_NEPGR|nr:hypothetical protein Nepgr_017977 [Nepenthes gracilis]
MSRGLQDHSLVPDLKLSPQEGDCAASGENSTCGPGPVSSSPLANVDAPSAPGAECSAAGLIGTTRTNGAIITSLSDASGRKIYDNGASHEAAVETQLGSLSSAGLDGECYVVPVPLEHDVSCIFSGSGVQSPEAQRGEGLDSRVMSNECSDHYAALKMVCTAEALLFVAFGRGAAFDRAVVISTNGILDDDPPSVALGNDDFGGALCLELVRVVVNILLSFWVVKLCPLAAQQLVAVGLEKAPASCSSFTADSRGLDALRLDVDHEQPNAASGD